MPLSPHFSASARRCIRMYTTHQNRHQIHAHSNIPIRVRFSMYQTHNLHNVVTSLLMVGHGGPFLLCYTAISSFLSFILMERSALRFRIWSECLNCNNNSSHSLSPTHTHSTIEYNTHRTVANLFQDNSLIEKLTPTNTTCAALARVR